MNEVDVLWLLLIILVSAGLTWLHYQKKFNKQPKQALLFAIPRFLAYLCIGILLLNPKVEQSSYFIEKPNLIIGADNSLSIGQLTNNTTYKKNITSLVEDEGLKDNFNLQAYTFSDDFQELESIDLRKSQTNISKFLNDVAKLYTSSNAFIILLSDGQQTLGQDYLYTSRQIDKGIIPVVIGDTTAYVDTKIDRINTNSYTFINNQFPVEVFLSYNGSSPAKTEFILKRNGRILSQKPISFSETDNTKNIELFLKADVIGVNTYEAYLKPLDEKNTINNKQVFAIEVIDERTKILLLYDKLHPDIGMLKKSIESNPQRELKINQIKSNKEDLAEYNLIIFYQPNESFKTAYYFVNKQNINHMVVTGGLTDFRFLNKMQEHFQKEVTDISEDYYAELNTTYASYQQDDIGFQNFPPLKNIFGNTELKSNFDILLYQNINGISTQEPLIMSISDNNKKLSYVFGENLWRWRMKSYVDNNSFEKFDKFIDQLIQFTSSTETKKRLVVDLKSIYNNSNDNIVNAQYFDRNYNFDSNQKVTLIVTNKSNLKTYSYNLTYKNGKYSTNINNLSDGDYNYKVVVEDKNLSESGEFKVLDYIIEKSFFRADKEKLSQLSDTVFYENQFEELKSYLMSQQKFKPIQKSIIKKESLINWWWLFILIVVFLSLEWFLRKYHGLI